MREWGCKAKKERKVWEEKKRTDCIYLSIWQAGLITHILTLAHIFHAKI